MTFDQFLQAMLKIYFEAFQFDMMVFSTKLWMYYWLCIPAVAYLCFFCMKWMVITLPLWIAPTVIFQSFAKLLIVILRRKAK